MRPISPVSLNELNKDELDDFFRISLNQLSQNELDAKRLNSTKGGLFNAINCNCDKFCTCPTVCDCASYYNFPPDTPDMTSAGFLDYTEPVFQAEAGSINWDIRFVEDFWYAHGGY